MNRFHLLELSEQHWFPSFLFTESIEFLQFFENVSNVFGAATPLLRRVLEGTGTRKIIDLCSGSGGPWPRLSRYLQHREGTSVTVCLTDKNPRAGLLKSAERFRGNGISFCPRPVDATNIPDDLDGILTFFNAFHHFTPPEAQRILCDAARSGRGIAIFEATERRMVPIIQMALVLPAAVWALTPLIRPFRLSRLFWTYCIPLLPLIITVDGIVSSLRTYTPEELEHLALDCGVSDYTWETGTTKARRVPRNLTWIIGYPSERPEGNNHLRKIFPATPENDLKKKKKAMDNRKPMVYNVRHLKTSIGKERLYGGSGTAEG